MPTGFQRGKVYELDYVARNPLVLGLGYAASRDVLSFLRYATADEQGTPNPLAVDSGGALLGQGENYRFGQLNPWSDQHRGRIYPNVTFPFNWGIRENPLVANG